MGIFTSRGVSPAHKKHTENQKPTRLNGVESVTIPMKQHIGAPCEPTVKVGDSVKVGQVIGDTGAFMSAPIHASVSGTVARIAEIRLASGEKVKAVTIKSDGLMELYEGATPPQYETVEQFLSCVRASGLVGLGGAGFPAHVKLKVPEGKVDTLVINAAECEPYITTDNRECIDNTADVIDGIELVCKVLGLKSAVIGIENNKPEAIRALRDEVARRNSAVIVKALKSKYPQGAEKVLIHSATGRVVPMGGLPMDAGCIVMNVASIAFLARYMRTGKPLVTRTVTVDGSAIASPCNLRVPIGAPLQAVVDAAGGFKCDAKKIILGGPMMGNSVSSLDYFITKTNNALLAFDEKDARPKKESACIRCGRCVSVCPMKLMPASLEKYRRCGDAEGLEKGAVLNCIECGCCSFTCPAGRQLVQSIRLGKSIVRTAQAERKKKEAEKND
ncbi:MAG: electron transport complex subunit RsxC [Clostridia bacterium]|nr:electron transport complex subunit RsxC [Clostridia bacterium]